MTRKLHRKQADRYKALSDEERAQVRSSYIILNIHCRSVSYLIRDYMYYTQIKARLVARDQEREARLNAVHQIDTPFVHARRLQPQQQQSPSSPPSSPQRQQAPPSLPPQSNIALTPHLRLCVDLGYGEELHGARGTRSLGQQLGWVWNAMKLAKSERDTPVLHLVSYEGKVCTCVMWGWQRVGACPH